jgi:hypothetical protein
MKGHEQQQLQMADLIASSANSMCCSLELGEQRGGSRLKTTHYLNLQIISFQNCTFIPVRTYLGRNCFASTQLLQ